MSRDEFDPDLSSLGADYQILEPLQSSPDTRRYLARHIGLNRDVTITVVRLPGAAQDGTENALTHYASDARTLSVMRHRNVVPVVEGRWLPDTGSVFAIVRARVRGKTLHELMSDGALPPTKVANALEQAQSAVDWARSNGIVHRHVAPASMVFQQGSGRVLLELDPSPLGAGALPAVCDDARTIGELAYAMLTGNRLDEYSMKPLAEIRRDLPAEIATETEKLLQCEKAENARGVTRLVSLLRGRPAPAPAPPPVSAPATLGAPVTVVKQRFGYNARFASAAAVVIIIGVLSLVLLNRGERPTTRPSAKRTAKTGDAAGEVQSKPRVDTPRRVMPPTSVVPLPTTPPTRPIEPPETRRREPPRGQAPLVAPKPIPPEPVPPERRDTVVVPAPPPVVVSPPPRDTVFVPRAIAPSDRCDSADVASQESCLANAIARTDEEMNNTYTMLITGLRRQAGIAADAPDPPSVDALREAQQSWSDARTNACRDAGLGPLYARTRAACYSERTTSRTRELRDRLATIP